MTDQQHPITPLAQLVREWTQEVIGTHFKPYGYSEFIATRAAQWGADQELGACCEWLKDFPHFIGIEEQLRAARRPKPPSLKEQALAALNEIEDKMLGPTVEEKLIRRALESIND